MNLKRYEPTRLRAYDFSHYPIYRLRRLDPNLRDVVNNMTSLSANQLGRLVTGSAVHGGQVPAACWRQSQATDPPAFSDVNIVAAGSEMSMSGLEWMWRRRH